jgi:hypothetical protein
MLQSLGRYSAPVLLVRAPSLADFITTMVGLRFSVRGLANLGYVISDQTVGNVLQRHALPPAPERKRTTTQPVFPPGAVGGDRLLYCGGADAGRAGDLLRTFFHQVGKEECLSKLILLGERSLRFALSEYVEHYHTERNHQGKDNVLLFSCNTSVRYTRHVQCRERLGGAPALFPSGGGVIARPRLNPEL